MTCLANMFVYLGTGFLVLFDYIEDMIKRQADWITQQFEIDPRDQDPGLVRLRESIWRAHAETVRVPG